MKFSILLFGFIVGEVFCNNVSVMLNTEVLGGIEVNAIKEDPSLIVRPLKGTSEKPESSEDEDGYLSPNGPSDDKQDKRQQDHVQIVDQPIQEEMGKKQPLASVEITQDLNIMPALPQLDTEQKNASDEREQKVNVVKSEIPAQEIFAVLTETTTKTTTKTDEEYHQSEESDELLVLPKEVKTEITESTTTQPSKESDESDFETPCENNLQCLKRASASRPLEYSDELDNKTKNLGPCISNRTQINEISKGVIMLLITMTFFL